ncbi:hypothetical protein BKA63DRAFT_584093 [Paraphoma chrysanthemicola]|nr:hypothetical protein BKA63DRAFT_584093 [Paraphoma chrysanthemicola]
MPVHENLVLNPDRTIAINQLMWIYFIGSCILFLIALALIVFVLWVKAMLVGLWTGDWTDLYGPGEQKKNEEANGTNSLTMKCDDLSDEERNENMEVLEKDEKDINGNCTSDDADDSNDIYTPEESDGDSDVPSLVRDDEDESVDFEYDPSARQNTSSVFVREERNGTLDDGITPRQEVVEFTFPPIRRSRIGIITFGDILRRHSG